MNELSAASGNPNRAPDAFNPFDARVINDPYPIFAWYRTHDPVHWNPLMGAWFVFAKRVLSDQECFGRGQGAGPTTRDVPVSLGEVLGQGFLFTQDPPQHTRLKSQLSHAFPPKAAESLRSRVRHFVTQLLDRAQAQGADIEFMAQVAFPLALLVMGELLGLPIEVYEPFRRRTDEFLAAIDPSLPPAGKAAASEAAAWFQGLFTLLIAQRSQQPQQDLISHLLEQDEHSERLTSSEVIALCITMLVAGFETTALVIGNALLALLEHPEQLARLREQPDLAAAALEESVRYAGPPQYNPRVANREVVLSGKLIRQADTVFAMHGSADRDPTQFPDPDTFDIFRFRDRQPDHLGFGWGINYCLGPALARLEFDELVQALWARTTDLRLQQVSMRDQLAFRGPRELVVALEWGRTSPG